MAKGIALEMSAAVEEKLKAKHGVSKQEVVECFQNRTRQPLVDTREEHKTDPPTRCFIAETDKGRELKVVYIFYADELLIDVKTAYPPDEKEKQIYKKYSVC